MSQRRVLEQERIASYAFLEHLMREDKDKAFVIHFDWDIELLQDLTSSRKKLNIALEKLDNPEFEQSGAGGSGGHRRGGGTTLYDAVFLGSDELMQKQQGRKALIILSDGVDTGSKITLPRAIEAAQRANTLVYSILFSDKDAYDGGYGGHIGPNEWRNGPSWRRRHGSRRSYGISAADTTRWQESSAKNLKGDRWSLLRGSPS